MTEIKLRSDHPQSMQERINRRLRNSGDERNADVVVKTGDSARRTYNNIFHSANHVGLPVMPVKDGERR